eukprot:TRINITY_DN54452_c0_g1_i1.p1 TRINITY_DN54452_c0_g1~~TRINITY_DN54452_c0_g1_i1.p1  ORF type:complete len:807 (-),score=188.73 TRINITY_DN54452_c0_g1_i1:127-2547(-)
MSVRRLLYWEDGTLLFDEETAGFISTIPAPFKVISVAGAYRSGKSFLLNQLAGFLAKDGGFPLGGTVSSCTQGILAACVQVEGERVLLLDTEGLYDFQRTNEHDIVTLCCAVLLASCFVFNSVGVLESQSIDKLSVVLEVANKVRPGLEEDSENFDEVFPEFVWVLRDFFLELTDEIPQYLERALRDEKVPVKSGPTRDSMLHRNELRFTMRNWFKRRTLKTLPRPVVDEEALLDVESHLGELSPKFVKSFELLAEHLIHQTGYFCLQGAEASGAAFVAWARLIVAAMMSDKMPSIPTMMGAVVSGVNNAAVQTAVKAYTEQMQLDQSAEPVSAAHLEERHELALALAESLFESNRMGGAADARSELHNQVSAAYEVVCSKNYKRSERFNIAVLNRLAQDLRRCVADNSYLPPNGTYDDFLDATGAVLEQYDACSRGPAADSVLAQFKENHEQTSKQLQAAGAKCSELQRNLEESEKQKREFEAAVKQLEESQTRTTHRMKEMDQKYTKDITAAKTDYETKIGNLQKLGDQREKAARDELARGNQANAEALKRQAEQGRLELVKETQRFQAEMARLQQLRNDNNERMRKEREARDKEIAELKNRPPIIQQAPRRGSCFLASSVVFLEDSTRKEICQVNVGDRVAALSAKDGALGFSTVYFTASNSKGEVEPLRRVTTATGHELTLTPDHMVHLATEKPRSVPAHALRLGDELFVLPSDARAAVPSKITKIEETEGPTHFALTDSGSICVSGVACGDWSEGDPTWLFPVLRVLPRALREASWAPSVTRAVELAWRRVVAMATAKKAV